MFGAFGRYGQQATPPGNGRPAGKLAQAQSRPQVMPQVSRPRPYPPHPQVDPTIGGGQQFSPKFPMGQPGVDSAIGGGQQISPNLPVLNSGGLAPSGKGAFGSGEHVTSFRGPMMQTKGAFDIGPQVMPPPSANGGDPMVANGPQTLPGPGADGSSTSVSPQIIGDLGRPEGKPGPNINIANGPATQPIIDPAIGGGPQISFDRSPGGRPPMPMGAFGWNTPRATPTERPTSIMPDGVGHVDPFTRQPVNMTYTPPVTQPAPTPSPVTTTPNPTPAAPTSPFEALLSRIKSTNGGRFGKVVDNGSGIDGGGGM